MTVINRLAGCSLAALALSACAVPQAVPNAAAPLAVEAVSNEEALVADLVSRMSLERKVAQLIQPQINSFTAEDMERYRFGSYLNGGNGGPGGDEFAPASEWLALADEMWTASTRPLPGDEPAIPTMWGTDAVHGHTNIVGATIFPHNIGLGATRDADLVRRIGQATAVEIEVTGIDWNFSPTVAVARDDRWGRTYESYSEDPAIVSRLGSALVQGLQGVPGEANYLGSGHVVATAKHFFGDGGTEQGVDQGDVNGDLDRLKSIHAAPYPAAIEAGVEAIMASFNSINGRKMHGNEALLTDYLRGELGFDGLVVGDWNGHGQVAGCTVDDCPQSLNAGLDIYMVPDDWKALHTNLVAQVRDGTIPMARLDEAVSRVLRVKARAGLIGPDAVRPSARPHAGDYARLGSAAHRAIAREAVAKSQVVLKNDGVLPFGEGVDLLVAGSAADDVARAAGGWTLTWQGGGELTEEHFPGATSIWSGLEAAAQAAGGRATLSPDGAFDARPDVAVVVFGEKPYAEFAGDRKDLVFRDEEGLDLLRRFEAEGIPTVALFLSGRPLWMNRELNLADAFVASWLPGSEGAGVADILFGRVPAIGRLSFSWPADCVGTPVNGPDGALFEVGYGRSLDDTTALGALDEECAALSRVDGSSLFGGGRLGDGAIASALPSDGEPVVLEQFRGEAPVAGIAVRGIDRNAQEDAREIRMAAGSAFAIAGGGHSDRAYRIVYKVDRRPGAPVLLETRADGEVVGTVDVTQGLSIAEGKDWREMVITEACVADLGSGIGLRSEAAFTIQVAEVSRAEVAEGAECSF